MTPETKTVVCGACYRPLASPPLGCTALEHCLTGIERRTDDRREEDDLATLKDAVIVALAQAETLTERIDSLPPDEVPVRAELRLERACWSNAAELLAECIAWKTDPSLAERLNAIGRARTTTSPMEAGL